MLLIYTELSKNILYILGTAASQKQTSVRKIEPEENMIKLIPLGIGIYLLTDLLPSRGTENQNLPPLP